MACELPLEAKALLEYAERHGLLLYSASPYRNEDEDAHLNPDFLYRSEEVWAELEAGEANSFFQADQFDLWRLIDPRDVLRKLEKDYQNAKTSLEIAEDYLGRFRKEMAESTGSSKKRA